ncbi:MAG: isochorismatase family protein, partial [Treponema sp.]|nr:isochorismatase family protein [Treponema sp.]
MTDFTLRASRAALLIVDAQNDFCPAYESGGVCRLPGGARRLPGGVRFPEGALAVPDGCDVIAPLNALSRAFALAGALVVATQDWHPRGHVSFASSHPGKKPGDLVEGANGRAPETLWPDHCAQGTPGADFHADLDLRPVSLIIR